MFAMVIGCFASEAQTTTDTVLWEGTTVCADDWSAGWQVIEATNFATAAVGDEIVVTVTEVSAACEWPQVLLQNGSWANFEGVESVGLWGEIVLPYEAKVTIIESMLNEMNVGGLVVKGAGLTFTKVVLRHNNSETGVQNVELCDNSTAAAVRYNLLGVPVGDDYKGIVICNGKKLVQK